MQNNIGGGGGGQFKMIILGLELKLDASSGRRSFVGLCCHLSLSLAWFIFAWRAAAAVHFSHKHLGKGGGGGGGSGASLLSGVRSATKAPAIGDLSSHEHQDELIANCEDRGPSSP